MKWESTEIAAHLAQKYNTRPEIQAAVYKFNMEKCQNMNRAFATKDNRGVEKLTGSIIDRYDSLSNIYETAAVGEAYLEKNIQLLEAWKPLEEKEKTVLRNTFLNACLKHGNNYYSNFHLALQFATNKKEYFDLLYKDSIRQEVLAKSKKELQHITAKYGLPESMSRKLSDIVQDKNRIELDLLLQLPYSAKRDSLLRENEEQHWAAIKKTMIRNGYYRLSNSRLVYAMRYEKALKLSPEQMDSLANKNYSLDMAIYQYSLMDPWNEYDATPFTCYQLEHILSPGQYDSLLYFESRPKALANTKRDWRELQKYGLATANDSATVYNELFIYHLNFQATIRRYTQDDAARQKFMKKVIDKKPQALKRLEAIIKMNEYDTATVK
jgi:hypothetical protein